MIHSTAGGTLKEYGVYDYAKVETEFGVSFFLSPFKELKKDDIVLVPIQDQIVEGKVLRVDKNVKEQNFPIPYKRLKKIIEIKKVSQN